MNRRTFLAYAAAALSYLLVSAGLKPPVFQVRRFLKCGSQVKLLFSQATFNPGQACWLNGSVVRGFGPLAGMLCRGFSASIQKDGSWRGAMTYTRDYGDAVLLDGKRRRVFQLHPRKWHNHFYGSLPGVEVVTPEEFESA